MANLNMTNTKNGEIIRIIKEFSTDTLTNSYDISTLPPTSPNEDDLKLSNLRFYYREDATNNYYDLPIGEYSIVSTSDYDGDLVFNVGSAYLGYDIQIAVLYNLDSTYNTSTNISDIILAYNKLQKDLAELWEHVRLRGLTIDTNFNTYSPNEVTLVLPVLGENQVWTKKSGVEGYVAFDFQTYLDSIGNSVTAAVAKVEDARDQSILDINNLVNFITNNIPSYVKNAVDTEVQKVTSPTGAIQQATDIIVNNAKQDINNYTNNQGITTATQTMDNYIRHNLGNIAYQAANLAQNTLTNSIDVNSPGHTITCNAVYWDGFNWSLAIADRRYQNSSCDGVAYRVDADNFRVLRSGLYEYNNTNNILDDEGNPLQLNEHYFLSNKVLGGFTRNKPESNIFQHLFKTVMVGTRTYASIDIDDAIDVYNPESKYVGTRINQPNHGFEFALVRYDETAKTWKTHSPLSGEWAEGVAVYVDKDNFDIITSSAIAIPTNNVLDDLGNPLVEGEYYFASETIGGKLQRTEPTRFHQNILSTFKKDGDIYTYINVSDTVDLAISIGQPATTQSAITKDMVLKPLEYLTTIRHNNPVRLPVDAVEVVVYSSVLNQNKFLNYRAYPIKGTNTNIYEEIDSNQKSYLNLSGGQISRVLQGNIEMEYQIYIRRDAFPNGLVALQGPSGKDAPLNVPINPVIYDYRQSVSTSGPQGVPGPKGDKGDKGDPGQSIIGPQGPQGIQGPAVTVIDNLNSSDSNAALSANQGRILNNRFTGFIVNDLTTASTTQALSAGQGKVLNDKINNLVVDSLASTSTTQALSANQGKILNDKVSSLVVDNLTSTSSVNALSAKQGKALSDRVGELANLTTTDKSDIVSAINEVNALAAAGGGTGGGGTTVVIDSLTSPSKVSALSANQGKVLNENKLEKGTYTGTAQDLSDLINLKYNNLGTEIPASSDLNNYKTPGHYKVGTNANAQTLLNSPFTQAFTLTVDSVINNYYTQIAQVFDTGVMKYRVFNLTAWSPWKTIANTDQIVSTQASNAIVKGTDGGAYLNLTTSATIFTSYAVYKYGNNTTGAPATGFFNYNVQGQNITLTINKVDANNVTRSLAVLEVGDDITLSDDPSTPPVTSFGRYVITGKTDNATYFTFNLKKLDSGTWTAPTTNTSIRVYAQLQNGDARYLKLDGGRVNGEIQANLTTDGSSTDTLTTKSYVDTKDIAMKDYVDTRDSEVLADANAYANSLVSEAKTYIEAPIANLAKVKGAIQTVVPTPDAPIELAELPKDFEIVCRGKNAIDYSKERLLTATHHSVRRNTFVDVSGVQRYRVTRLSSAEYGDGFSVFFKQGKNTISFKMEKSANTDTAYGEINLAYYDEYMLASYPTIPISPAETTLSYGIDNNNASLTFNIPKEGKYFLGFSRSGNDTQMPAGTYTDIWDIQVESGNTATEYEEYVENRYPISINEPLRKIDEDVKDIMIINDTELTVERNIAVDENYDAQAANLNQGYTTAWAMEILGTHSYTQLTRTKAISSICLGGSYVLASNTENCEAVYNQNGNLYLYLALNKTRLGVLDTDSPSQIRAKFSTYLSGKTVRTFFKIYDTKIEKYTCPEIIPISGYKENVFLDVDTYQAPVAFQSYSLNELVRDYLNTKDEMEVLNENDNLQFIILGQLENLVFQLQHQLDQIINNNHSVPAEEGKVKFGIYANDFPAVFNADSTVVNLKNGQPHRVKFELKAGTTEAQINACSSGIVWWEDGSGSIGKMAMQSGGDVSRAVMLDWIAKGKIVTVTHTVGTDNRPTLTVSKIEG